MNDNKSQYKTISEVAEILDLVNKKTGKLLTHTLRFWKKNLNKLDQKYLLANEDIMMIKYKYS